MAVPTNSFKQFDYALRPSKQVERKIMIEVLLKLAKADYMISDYTYLGFGSVYYVDFVMFHKYLFIEKMVCVEWGEIGRRMRFNKPFKFIKLKLEPLANHIPTIKGNQQYFAWLDYDRSLDSELLQDIDGVVTRLSVGSIFVVTIDARARLPKDEFDIGGMTEQQREHLTLRVYKEWFQSYVGSKLTRALLAGSHVAGLFYEVVIERIRQSLTRRDRHLRFIQIFNFVYRDGAPMLTVGGMIGTSADETALAKAGVLDHRFVRTGDDYLEISVPPLTLREKQWIDCRLDQKLTTKRLRFELDEDLLLNYRSFYREYPTYLETLL